MEHNRKWKITEKWNISVQGDCAMVRTDENWNTTENGTFSVQGDEATVRELVGEGANPNTRDHAGWTPLHEACQHGNLGAVEALLEHGAMVSVPGENRLRAPTFPPILFG